MAIKDPIFVLMIWKNEEIIWFVQYRVKWKSINQYMKIRKKS